MMTAHYLPTPMDLPMPMDEERIRRIARAMCRASRLDPDQPISALPERPIILAPPEANEPDMPAWQLFRNEAERFVARHRDVALSL